jgi:Ca2+-binding EF-hand superfamily protein
MGNFSGTLSEDDLNGLSKITGSSVDEIHTLHANFRHLDKDHKGFVSKKDIIDRLGTTSADDKVFLNKLLDLFSDKSPDHRVSFQEFIIGLSDLRSDNKDSKLRLLFDLIDSDKNGLLGAKELEEAFKLVKLEHLTKQDITEIAHQTLIYADVNQDGFLDFEEFKEFYNTVLQITI